ncbi:DUF4345 family protein [Saccharopolyspora indica]|uniref:DUF4345 family protein n=1 Tax=Saccharopolyspora indica TaxID=1229659 RepID=UPI0022EA901A|nr:DUF4345 family protein [Saccharopolyspora indica]MDA3643610.1 DUF4345 family protein [Saccharopolyspora indica]
MDAAFLVIVTTFFAGLGLFGLIAPAALLQPFAIDVSAPESRSEVRAVYGGFGIAIAAVLVVAVLDVAGMRRGIAIAVAAALLGMAAGRVVSRLADRRTRFYPVWFYFWVELAGAGMLVAAAW